MGHLQRLGIRATSACLLWMRNLHAFLTFGALLKQPHSTCSSHACVACGHTIDAVVWLASQLLPCVLPAAEPWDQVALAPAMSMATCGHVVELKPRSCAACGIPLKVDRSRSSSKWRFVSVKSSAGLRSMSSLSGSACSFISL